MIETINSKTISFMASGNGSAAKSVINAIRSGIIKNARVGVCVTDSYNNFYDWCEENNVFVVCLKNSRLIKDIFLQFSTDFIFLSGYLKKIDGKILDYYKRKIINIHPSLLPRYGGKGMYGDHVHKAVLASGDKMTGVTIHVVDEEYDTGEILSQAFIEVKQDDSMESLRERVKAMEKYMAVLVIYDIVNKELL